MLDFRYLELEDRAWLQPLLANTGNIGSENAFGTLMIWPGALRVKVCRSDSDVFLSFGADRLTYYYPVACRDLKDALNAMIQDAQERGMPFRMWGMTEQQVQLMEAAMPGTFSFSLDRPGSDYIYSAADLINLKGRKYEKKRNHLSKFKRAYTYSYEEVGPSNLPDCLAICEEWGKLNLVQPGDSMHIEYCALKKAIENFVQLDFKGGLIRVNGKPVSFTIGEEINQTAFLLHFEKALEGYDGLYAAINQEFAAHHLEKYLYVNREEDMGIEGLRKAKLSYFPVFILEKHIAVLKGGE